MIVESDLPALVDLLARGFPARDRNYWARALDTLTQRKAPEGLPRFGYLLEQDGAPVGVILMIFRVVEDGDIRCNISSWYADGAHRGYASLLIAAALRHKGVTYVNISPAPHTWSVIEAQGFRRYCNGQMLTAPILARSGEAVEVDAFDPGSTDRQALAPHEQEMMVDHIARGCIGLVVREDERAHPFLFFPRPFLWDKATALQLAYCRSLDDYVHFARPLGRALLARGHLFVIVDALEKIDGLPGVFFKDRGPKYARGPCPPRLGDLSYCENILFGA
jgi:hypothetical protein